MPVADMRLIVAAIDDRPRHSGGGCTLSKLTPRPAAVASEMGQQRTIQKGGAVRQSVAKVAEALRVGNEGLQSGQWDLFRGQTDADWLVTSSAERLSDEQRERAFERVNRLAAWAETIDAMAGYVARPDSLWAIAQHYGLPTQFIDFSDDPRVAAFFACDSRTEPSANQMAAIICLNSEDFVRFWKQVGPALLKNVENPRYPELLRIGVDNLWRLQKQKGSFLWSPIYGIEQFYDFDRIIFPCVRNDHALPQREDIYPIHQSALEHLLTQFFMNERMIAGSKTLRELNVPVHKIEAPVDSYEMKSWWPAGVAVAEDWSGTEAWDKEQIEHSDITLPGAVIELDPSHSLDQISKALCAGLSPAFIDANRTKALDINACAPDRLMEIAGVSALVSGGSGTECAGYPTQVPRFTPPLIGPLSCFPSLARAQMYQMPLVLMASISN